MRDTKVLESFKKLAEKKLKEMDLFRYLKKEVEANANGKIKVLVAEEMVVVNNNNKA